ncbi:cell division protein ZapE [Thaumasiovibrio sp. DFM-14]|uniref:cell division protein ZapE n=1 Tax=Thaumasiovibrio sp. DFM-14 TaxID=3384792 RepID=UPI0039A08D94
MTPRKRYQQDLQQDGFNADAAQAAAVECLEGLYQRLITAKASVRVDNKRSWWQRWQPQKTVDKAPEQGLYLWGGVGRGKTYLMDLFYECLPTSRKMRVHFHRFMHRVHHELGLLDGQSDPLLLVADKLAHETDILCFDEFFVSDITDAMLLGTLFDALFRRGVCLVATSNIPPHDLYRNGLQRARFLPAIALLEQHCDVLHLDGGIDYRLRTLEQAEIYHAPLDEAASANMTHYFAQLRVKPWTEQAAIMINDRELLTLSECDGVVQFEFAVLCVTARSQIDYMEIARIYHTVLLCNVAQMGDEMNDAARRFIALVDEFYERNVKLIISAQVPMTQLYTGKRLSFEFERCCSRLIEMQSHAYLSRPHLPA